MKKLYFILALCVSALTTNAQPYETNPDFKRANHWLFGNKVWLDFNHNPPQNKDRSQLNSIEASTSYSDEYGNLLIYSDGLTIWNGNHNVIINGAEIEGHQSSSQGAVFVSMPNNKKIVYLFTTDELCKNKGLKYSKIYLHDDMDSFVVLEKNIPIISNVTETIAVTQHQNKIDYWIVVRSSIGKEFYSFLLTSEGLIDCPIISYSERDLIGNNAKCQTKSKFNNNGNIYAFLSAINGYVELYFFNTSHGTLDDLSYLGNLNIPTGIEFVNSDSFLYFLEGDFRVNRLNINTKKRDTIYNFQNLNIQMIGILKGVNNLMYLNIVNSDTLAIISNFEEPIPIVNLKGQGINDKRLTNDLPNFNQSFFYTPSINFIVKLNCVNNTIQFFGQDTFNANNHNWLITKQGASSITNNSKDPLIEFEDTGVYKVRYVASNGVRSDTLTKEVDILTKIEKNFLGNDTGWCEQLGSSLTIQAPQGMHCYQWNTGEATSQISTDTTGVYIAKITTPNFCVLYDTINIIIDSIPDKPVITTSRDTLKTNMIENVKYQWYKDEIMTGSNQPYLVYSDSGIYKVEIITSGGCSNVSDTVQIKNTGVKNIRQSAFVKVFPNPIENYFYIEVLQTKENLKAEIIDITGKKVFDIELSVGLNKIGTSSIENGIYFLKIRLEDESTGIYKLIKIN